MNKEEFIHTLETQLLRLPKADRDDILSDYESHFASGLENGQTEEEVAAQLGDPTELAQVYLESLPDDAKGAPFAAQTDGGEQAAENAQSTSEAQYSAPVYAAPDYGNNQKAQAQNNAVLNSNGSKTGMIVLVVALSLFVALPVVGTIFSGIGTLIGIVFGGLAASIGLFAAGAAAVMINVMLGVGLMLLAIAAIILSALCVVGTIAAGWGTYKLIKWYVEKCKGLINGGAN